MSERLSQKCVCVCIFSLCVCAVKCVLLRSKMSVCAHLCVFTKGCVHAKRKCLK